jgi:hypothetical protein
MFGIQSKSVLARVERMRVVRGECWEVDIDTAKKYPQLKVSSKKVAVHRAVFAALHGAIPKENVVMHTCDNPRCHRPEHLKLGTTKENMQDMVAKGRHRTRKPVECDVVMAGLAKVLSQQEIAEIYGVSQAVISCALRRAGLARGKATPFGKGHGRGGWRQK